MLSWGELSGTTFANPELSNQSHQLSALSSSFYEITTPAGDLALGKNHGDSVALKIIGRISGTATSALPENQKVPMVYPPEYTVSTTVLQRGTAIPWTGLRSDLDRLDVESNSIRALRDHSSRTHNALIKNEAASGRSFTYVCTASGTGTFLADGSVAATAGANPNAFHYRDMRRQLEKKNTPPADGKNFLAIISPTAYWSGLLGDSTAVTGFVDVAKYGSQVDGILAGEVGQFMGFRFMKNDNDVLEDGIGTGSAFGSGFVFGLDAIREVTVYPMELRACMDLGQDFGRQKAIAWLSLLAFKTVYNYTAHGEGRTLHITSA